MRSIYVADVGDGVCINGRTIAGKSIQIDCGSLQGGRMGFEGLERTLCKAYGRSVFILSHFHIDHYNGLLYASLASHHRWMRPPAIMEVYYPRIPDFKWKKEFILYLFTMNLRIFGSETGVMEYDFLKAVSRINDGKRFKYAPVSQGGIIDVNGAILEVLWPPMILEDKTALSAVRRALEDFKKALEEDKITRQLYERVAQSGVFEEYFEDHWSTEESIQQSDTYVHQRPEYRTKLPKVAIRANKSLREAANHMGLALCRDNQVLFFGDLEDFEISEVVNHLRSKKRRNFHVVITPHHGTHWNESLRGIKCFYSVSSVGRRLCSKLDPRFKEISERSLATWVNGDIVLPMSLTGRILSRLLWW